MTDKSIPSPASTTTASSNASVETVAQIATRILKAVRSAETDDALRKVIEFEITEVRAEVSRLATQRQTGAEAVAPEAKPNWNERSHLAHCFQGEYLHSCKYGDDECPAAPPAPPSPHRRSRPNE